MMTEVTVDSEEDSNTVLTLAPVSVLPEVQNKGIGKALIEALEYRAYENGYIGVVVMGDETYYREVGYRNAEELVSYPSVEIKNEDFMLKYLWNHTNKEVRGIVHFPEEFR